MNSSTGSNPGDSSGAPASAAKPPMVSRLAVPGSISKRPRNSSTDLETGLEIASKKQKLAAEQKDNAASNLSRAKSKSVMNVTGRTNMSIRGGVSRTVTRPGMSRTTVGNRSGVASIPARPTLTANRRATTSAALNPSTNSSINNRSALKDKNTTVPTKPGGKRPAWDLKGRLEDMEKKFVETNSRLHYLENEKTELQTDCNLKTEVVVQQTEENKNLKESLDEKTKENSELKKKVADLEDSLMTETNRLKRRLEEEEFNKNSLERKLKSLEGELDSKVTENCGLKTTVAELTATRSKVENELEFARTRNEELTTEVGQLKEELEDVKNRLNWNETERRKLHNQVQELKGNIRVFCRVRPLLGEEVEKYGSIKHVLINTDRSLELIKNVGNESDSIASGLNKNMKYEFEFDKVFQPRATQKEVFEEISQLVQSAVDGYNVCVFAYGQTGSGKTFTMEGGSGDDESQDGMIPLALRQLFRETSRLKENGWDYSLQASFLEIYNEEIRDLWATEKNLKYEIKMNDSKGTDVHVTNLKIETVTSEGQISNLLKRARKHRAVAETHCNERSSRSHSVFTLRISGENSVTTESSSGTLNLVDLAGSERIKDSGSEGQRLTEAQAINKSLSNLGNVIMALAQKNSHIPYRNSKLTHLLQNSLGGNSKSLMFVNVSPREDCFNETLNSLRFATKVNQCHIGTATKKIK